MTNNSLNVKIHKYSWNSVFTRYFIILFLVFTIIFSIFINVVISNVNIRYNNAENAKLEKSAIQAQTKFNNIFEHIIRNYSRLSNMPEFTLMLNIKKDVADADVIRSYEKIYDIMQGLEIYNEEFAAVYIYSKVNDYVYSFGKSAANSNYYDYFAKKELFEHTSDIGERLIFVQKEKLNARAKNLVVVYNVSKNGCVVYDVNLDDFENVAGIPFSISDNTGILYSSPKYIEENDEAFESYFNYTISIDDKLVMTLRKGTSGLRMGIWFYVVCYFSILLVSVGLSILIANIFYSHIEKLCNLICDPFVVDKNSSQELKYISSQIQETAVNNKKNDEKLRLCLQQLSITQATALQLQISPHFLLNTLNLISSISLAESKKETRITDVVERLSEMLYVVLNTSEMLCSLAEEIKYTCAYIEIQRYKYGNFDVEWNIGQEYYEIPIVKFTLQPIIENALHHGIAGEKDGKIKISGYVENSFFVIEVYNNGRNAEPGDVNRVNERIKNDINPGISIGLWNTRKRLKILLGEKSDVKFKEQKIGTTTVVKIPH